MFDLNQILSAALNAAVAEAIKPLVERMGLLEAALADRHERIAALENNPAIGTDTVLAERVAALEERVDNTTEASEHRIRVIAEAAAEQVMEDHTSSYDHDDYDALHNEWGGEEASDFIRDRDIQDQIEEAVKEVLNNAHFTVSI
jgi:hypothetical protein